MLNTCNGSKDGSLSASELPSIFTDSDSTGKQQAVQKESPSYLIQKQAPIALVTSQPPESSGRKRLACSNCRRRRKKCDLNYPCSTCCRLKLQCNVIDEDLRKKRYSSSYVKNLENHVAILEEKLRVLASKTVSKGSVPPTRSTHTAPSTLSENGDKTAQSLFEVTANVPYRVSTKDSLHTPDLSKHMQEHTQPHLAEYPYTSETQLSMSTHENKETVHRAIFVNGSIYPEGPAGYKPKVNDNQGKKKTALRISDLRTTKLQRNLYEGAGLRLNSDPSILKCLSNFYTWVYPGYFIFVHRESFLYGFFNNSEDNYESSEYCSEELIYAVAAIGSRLSPELHTESETYYKCAKDRLLKIVFDNQVVAKITTVQALLCLAFYELGKGNNQLTWYYSGLAIRVGYDMGFQLDPKVWLTEDSSSSPPSNSELEIRSRIYWGCYIADHFICLLLGRTPTLNVSNSTVPESDELPEIEGTEDFRFESRCVLQISLPLKNLIILSRIIQIFTSKIFIEPTTPLQRVEYLMKFNLKVYNWRQSLPDFLKWSQTLIKSLDVSTDPTISYFWYHYYIVLLTFNKPFLHDCEEAKIVTLEALSDLKTLFSNFKLRFQSLRKAGLYHLYSCLLAIGCLEKLLIMQPDHHISSVFPDLNHENHFFETVFHELAPAFDLPKKLLQDTKKKAQSATDTLHPFDSDPQISTFNHINNLGLIHDFSLSDEIDDLIKQVFGFEHRIDPTHSL